MKTYFILILIFSFTTVLSSGQNIKTSDHKIQIALLLDVSGSMDGLIAQAKGQIWRMVNQLMKCEKNNKKPTIQLALGSFGNLESESNGFFQLYTPLTSDIDLLSDKLCNLKTEGNNEFCGYAIQYTLDSLDWSQSKDDLKVIFIAGNEAFNQGPIDYTKACKNAMKQNVIVNTIYCGKPDDGIKLLWEDASTNGKGKYMVINQDSSFKYGETFWDKKIIELNYDLNQTYIPYGQEGEKNLKRQEKLDSNAQSLGNAYLRERVTFKISESYINITWDLNDAYSADTSILSRLLPENLPANMKEMTFDKRKQFLIRKMSERELFKESIANYILKATEALQASFENNGGLMSLDNTIIAIIKEQATKKGFIFK